MSASRVHRVAVWSTGWIGRIAIRAVHRRADMELVGVWVHSPQKEGRDAGELGDTPERDNPMLSDWVAMTEEASRDGFS